MKSEKVATAKKNLHRAGRQGQRCHQPNLSFLAFVVVSQNFWGEEETRSEGGAHARRICMWWKWSFSFVVLHLFFEHHILLVVWLLGKTFSMYHCIFEGGVVEVDEWEERESKRNEKNYLAESLWNGLWFWCKVCLWSDVMWCTWIDERSFNGAQPLTLVYSHY